MIVTGMLFAGMNLKQIFANKRYADCLSGSYYTICIYGYTDVPGVWQ